MAGAATAKVTPDRRNRRRLCFAARRTGATGHSCSAGEKREPAGRLDLVVARARVGFVTELDVNQQQQLLASTKAQRPPLIADIFAMRHAIAVLMGQQPVAQTVRTRTRLSQYRRSRRGLPVGLPSELLRARPDIRMAERKLAQATAEIGVATADLYPKFNLLAAITSASTGIGGLFNSSSITEAGLGGISWPIFHGGQIHANIRAKEEEEKQAYYAYQKAVLGGVQDAEDSLVRYQTEQQRFVALRRSGAKTAQRYLLRWRCSSIALAWRMYTSVLQAQIHRTDGRGQFGGKAAPP